MLRSLPHRCQPSPNLSRVGFRITLFEACSTFTRVTACTIAKSLEGPSTPKASTASLPPRLLRLLPAGATVAGRVSHPLEDSAFSRRTKIKGLRRNRKPFSICDIGERLHQLREFALTHRDSATVLGAID